MDCCCHIIWHINHLFTIMRHLSSAVFFFSLLCHIHIRDHNHQEAVSQDHSYWRTWGGLVKMVQLQCKYWNVTVFKHKHKLRDLCFHTTIIVLALLDSFDVRIKIQLSLSHHSLRLWYIGLIHKNKGEEERLCSAFAIGLWTILDVMAEDKRNDNLIMISSYKPEVGNFSTKGWCGYSTPD